MIKKDLQSRFILRFVTITAVWATTTVAIFAFLAVKKLDVLRYSSHFDIQTISELLLPMTIIIEIISLLIFAAILAHTIRSLLAKYEQPLTALKKSIARIADGDLGNKIELRKEDEF